MKRLFIVLTLVVFAVACGQKNHEARAAASVTFSSETRFKARMAVLTTPGSRSLSARSSEPMRAASSRVLASDRASVELMRD